MTDDAKGTAELVIRGQGMTREEALKRIFKVAAVSQVDPDWLVDVLVSLGVLKLDDPVEKLIEALRYRTTPHARIHPDLHVDLVQIALSAAGLRIVDAKDPNP